MLIFIGVSLDGPAEVHDSIRGVRGAFKRALETYRRLQAIKNSTEADTLNVKFEYTISKFNAGLLRKTLQAIKDEGIEAKVEDFVITFARSADFYNNLGEDVAPPLDVALEEATWALKHVKAGNLFSRILRAYLKAYLKYADLGSWRPPCVAGKNSCLVDPYGKVYPCIMLRYELGDLLKDGFNLSKIMCGEKALTFRRNMHKICPTCWTPCEAYQTIMGNLIKVVACEN